MAAGRRLALVHQAALVFSDKDADIAGFVEWGSLARSPARARMSPELRANVDRFIDQILTTGRLVIPTPQAGTPAGVAGTPAGVPAR